MSKSNKPCVTSSGSTSSSSNKVFATPELLELIGDNLSESDLFFCVQVNRHWNRILNPNLWYTVNTHNIPWSKLDGCYHPMKRPRGETEAWLRDLFAKHGQHIRYLEGDWNVVIETASFSPEVKNLMSLNVGEIDLLAVLPPVELPHRVSMGPRGIVRAPSATTAVPPVRWIPTKEKGSIKGQFLERFWALVRQNPGLIQLIVPGREPMLEMPGEHNINILRRLKYLTILDMGRMMLDVNIVLTFLPQLERLQGDTLLGLFALQKDYPGLRYLHCRCDFRISGALQMLSHLPNLEELSIKKSIPEQPYDILKKVVGAVDPFSKLTLLMGGEGDAMATVLSSG
ncbi:hypothetical protein BGZ47_003991 [Haplosporangium gracile]|nr:hypothetical protein BGZ47_003991 [Haplosporangium gracile]